MFVVNVYYLFILQKSTSVLWDNNLRVDFILSYLAPAEACMGAGRASIKTSNIEIPLLTGLGREPALDRGMVSRVWAGPSLCLSECWPLLPWNMELAENFYSLLFAIVSFSKMVSSYIIFTEPGQPQVSQDFSNSYKIVDFWNWVSCNPGWPQVQYGWMILNSTILLLPPPELLRF